MKVDKSIRMVPVRVITEGTLQVVIWQSSDEIRRHRSSQSYRIAIQRADYPLNRQPEDASLIAPEELSYAIQALEKAQEMLCLGPDCRAAASDMFVSANELMKVTARC